MRSERMRIPKELAREIRAYQQELINLFNRPVTIPRTWRIYIKKLKNGHKR